MARFVTQFSIFEKFISFFKWQKRNVDEARGVLEISDTDSSSWGSETDKNIEKRFLLHRRKGADFLSEHNLVKVGESSVESSHEFRLFTRFITGILLTQSLYLLLTYHSNWQSTKAAWACGTWGFFVAVAMAYSKGVRAIVYLMLPSFCTGKGRTILLTYVLMLLMNGPVANITYNYQVMSRSLMCGDELGYNVSQGLQSIVEDAQYAVLDTMDDTVDIILDAVDVAEDLYKSFAEKVENIADVIKSLNDFIRNIGDICNKKLGTFLCIIPRFVAQQAKKMITDPMHNAIERIAHEFYFTIAFDHEFVYSTNTSKSVSEISSGIMNEIKGKFSSLTNALHWTQFVMGFSTAFVIIKAVTYRKKYLTKDEFDNNYITYLFTHLDKKKAKHGHATILPLRPWETNLYSKPTRIMMSRPELKKFVKSVSFVGFNFWYAAAVIFVDYTFWYILRELTLTLSVHRRARNMLQDILQEGADTMTSSLGGGKNVKAAATMLVNLHVLGDGFVPIIYRYPSPTIAIVAIASSLQRLVSSEGYDMSIDRCLPEPQKPDLLTYAVLGFLFLLCFLMCFMEGYVLRTRRLIMAKAYPERERIRVLYLRAKIINERGVTSAFAEHIRSALVKIETEKNKKKHSMIEYWANRKGIFGAMCRYVTGKTAHRCSVCGFSGRKEERKLFQTCKRFGCGTEFCISCFDDLHRICPVCMMRHSKRFAQSKIKRLVKSQYDIIAEELIESSGISDSSAESEDEEVNSYTTSDSSYIRPLKNITFPKRVSFAESGESSQMLLRDSSTEDDEIY